MVSIMLVPVLVLPLPVEVPVVDVLVVPDDWVSVVEVVLEEVEVWEVAAGIVGLPSHSVHLSGLQARHWIS